MSVRIEGEDDLGEWSDAKITEGALHTTLADSGNATSTTSFNSRTAASMAVGVTFQGVGQDVSKYSRVGVSITATNKCRGTLYMQVSHDNVNWGGPPRGIIDARFAEPHMWNIVEKYFRIKYVNGNLPAENLSIQVQYSNNAGIILAHQLDQELDDTTEATAVRSVIVGRDIQGHYHNVAITDDQRLKVQSSDEFSHLLGALLQEQIKTNKLLKVISGYEMIDDIEDE